MARGRAGSSGSSVGRSESCTRARTCSMLTAASSRSRAASASRSTLIVEVMSARAFEALAESSSFCSTKSVTLLTSAPSRLLPVASSSSSSVAASSSRGVCSAAASPPFFLFLGLIVHSGSKRERCAASRTRRRSERCRGAVETAKTTRPRAPGRGVGGVRLWPVGPSAQRRRSLLAVGSRPSRWRRHLAHTS